MAERAKLWNFYKKLTNQKPTISYRSSSIRNIRIAINEFVQKPLKKQISKINIKSFFNNPKDNKKIKITKDNYHILNQLKQFYPDYVLIEHNGNQARTKIPGSSFDYNPLITKEQYGSDIDIEYSLLKNQIPYFTLEWRKKIKERKNGAFFPYFNNTNLDLTKYQIYTTNDKQNNLNCLQQALQQGGLADNQFQQLLTFFIKSNVSATLAKNDYIPKCKLKQIAEFFNIKIELTSLRIHHGKEEQVIERFGKLGETYKIGLLANHYFINEMTTFTKKDLGIKDPKGNFKPLTSFKLIRFMIGDKDIYLSPITYQNNISPYNLTDLKNYDTLYAPTEKEIKLIESKQINPPSIFKMKNKQYDSFEFGYFDFEAITDTNIHEAYQINYQTRNSNIDYFFQGPQCAINFLKSIKTNMIMYAHNLKYDLQFIIKYLSNLRDFIPNGSQFKSISGEFYNKDTKRTIKLCFKDSMSIIPEPLSKFGKMFNLEQHKEILPYEIYNKYTITQPSLKINLAKQYLSIEDYIHFKKNIKDWGLQLDDDKFDHMKYSEIYCKMDVKVLKVGFETMKEWMFDITQINIDYILSLPQLAYKFGINEGVFNGCHELSGQAREFIQRSLVGGRTMTRDNKQWHVLKRLQDFDGVSLYSSAIFEMDGTLLGLPKVIQENQLNKDFLDKQDGYFVEVDIIDIPIKRHFPLLSRFEKGESRDFTNDIRGRGIYLDKVGLEDAIKFQGIEYKIIRGYYFNEGRNPILKSFIQNLFNERLIKKKEGNPIQQCYKLIMNSFYGKTIQNPIDKNFKFIYGKEKADKSFMFNNATMISSTKISEELYMLEEHKSINQHFNLPHIGIEILSMSKRIMNRVMCLAEDNDIEIYYQDTDSMHIENDKIELLATEFKNKYNKELIGSNLGQFHCDFDFKSKDRLPVSIQSYFLGKKCYMDVISCMNNGVETFENHCRMRGVPSSCIKKFQCENLTSPKSYDNAVNIYKDLYNKDKINFELVDKRVFKYNKNFTFSKYDEAFTRTISF